MPKQAGESAENTSEEEERKVSLFEYALLGLIKFHPSVTGYELNSFIQESLGTHLEASLSYIYPTLNKLYKSGYVKFDEIAVLNRLPMKAYRITDSGEAVFQKWLGEPIMWRLSMRPFFIRMYFAVFMEEQLILDHIDREINCREAGLKATLARGFSIEKGFLDKKHVDDRKAEYLGNEILNVIVQTEKTRLRLLKEMRKNVEENLQSKSIVDSGL